MRTAFCGQRSYSNIDVELKTKVTSIGYGCRISRHCVGALSYADGVTILVYCNLRYNVCLAWQAFEWRNGNDST